MSNFITPLGRHVYGDLFKGDDKGFQNQPNPIDPETGKPTLKWAFGFAIEKTNPDLPAFIQTLQQEWQAAWPRGEHNQKLTATTPAFSNKIVDGDAAEYKDKPGYAGCIVVKFESKYPPSVYAPDGQRVITNPEELKRGYYFKVMGSITTNGNTAKPGMKMYHNKLLFCYAGEEIKGSSGFNVDAAGGAGEYRPAGAVDPNANPAGFGEVTSQPGNVSVPSQDATSPQQQGASAASGATKSPSSGPDYSFLNG